MRYADDPVTVEMTYEELDALWKSFRPGLLDQRDPLDRAKGKVQLAAVRAHRRPSAQTTAPQRKDSDHG